MVVMMIVMLLPILAIPVFWFLPLEEAIPLYIVCCLLSGSMFWIMRNNMKRPVKTGPESIAGKETRVISRSDSNMIMPYQVRIGGEIWEASSQDSLEAGETTVVVAVEGNKLIIKRRDNKQAK
jgi:membrane protein implicated in regulation of membrane protease activity